MNQLNQSVSCNKVVRCKQCFRLLCKRVPITLEDGSATWLVHIKHRGLELWTFDCTLKCVACQTTHRITGESGLVAAAKANDERPINGTNGTARQGD